MMARAFSGWAERVSWCKRMRLILERSARRLLYRRSAAAFRGWHEAAQMVKGKREGASMEQLQGQVAQLAVSDSCRQAGRQASWSGCRLLLQLSCGSLPGHPLAQQWLAACDMWMLSMMLPAEAQSQASWPCSAWRVRGHSMPWELLPHLHVASGTSGVCGPR
jgi:hypothetical protein